MCTTTDMHQRNECSPDESERYEQFLGYFLRDQYRVFAYILALIPSRSDADDIFQETSLVLWREYARFDVEREFLPWAIGIAKKQVLKHWRQRKSDRHIYNDALIEQLSDEAIEVVLAREPRMAALRDCLQGLTTRQQELVEQFYGKRLEAAAIAHRWERSVFTVYKALKVLRKHLLQCIDNKLAEGQVR